MSEGKNDTECKMESATLINFLFNVTRSIYKFESVYYDGAMWDASVTAKGNCWLESTSSSDGQK